MPNIVRGNGDGVDVLDGQQFLVILERLDIAADDLGGIGLARFGKIADRDLFDVIGCGVGFLVLDVELALVAGADVAHPQTVIGAGHVSRRRLVLPIDGRLENVEARGSGGGEGRFLDKFTARGPAVLGFV